MNKSKRREQQSWWQNISTSAKVFCIVGTVLIAVVLLVCYLVGMASDPKVVEKVVITAFILLVIILVIAFVACSVFDRVELGALRDEVIGLIQAEATKVEAETQYYYDAIDGSILQQIDLGDDDEKPIETLSEEQLANLRAEIEAGREANKTAGQDALERRYARRIQEHEEAERKAAEERAKEAGNVTRDSENKNPPIDEGNGQSKNPIIAQIGPGEHTGEAQPEKQPDSPEKQPKQPQKQPKVWPSVEEQAKELGISRSFLQYKLSMAGVPHHSLLSEKDQDEIAAFKQRGLRTANAVNL